MENLQYQQEEAVRFLKWIRDNKDKWEDILFLRAADHIEPERAIVQFETLSEKGFYTSLIMLICLSSYEIVLEKVTSKYTIEKVIEEVEVRGIKSVYEEFLYSFKKEFQRYEIEREEKQKKNEQEN